MSPRPPDRHLPLAGQPPEVSPHSEQLAEVSSPELLHRLTCAIHSAIALLSNTPDELYPTSTLSSPISHLIRSLEELQNSISDPSVITGITQSDPLSSSAIGDVSLRSLRVCNVRDLVESLVQQVNIQIGNLSIPAQLKCLEKIYQALLSLRQAVLLQETLLDRAFRTKLEELASGSSPQGLESLFGEKLSVFLQQKLQVGENFLTRLEDITGLTRRELVIVLSGLTAAGMIALPWLRKLIPEEETGIQSEHVEGLMPVPVDPADLPQGLDDGEWSANDIAFHTMRIADPDLFHEITSHFLLLQDSNGNLVGRPFRFEEITRGSGRSRQILPRWNQWDGKISREWLETIVRKLQQEYPHQNIVLREQGEEDWIITVDGKNVTPYHTHLIIKGSISREKIDSAVLEQLDQRPLRDKRNAIFAKQFFRHGRLVFVPQTLQELNTMLRGLPAEQQEAVRTVWRECHLSFAENIYRNAQAPVTNSSFILENAAASALDEKLLHLQAQGLITIRNGVGILENTRAIRKTSISELIQAAGGLPMWIRQNGEGLFRKIEAHLLTGKNRIRINPGDQIVCTEPQQRKPQSRLEVFLEALDRVELAGVYLPEDRIGKRTIPLEFQELVAYGDPPDESQWRENVTSEKGAGGFAQLMPDVARNNGLLVGYYVADPRGAIEIDATRAWELTRINSQYGGKRSSLQKAQILPGTYRKADSRTPGRVYLDERYSVLLESPAAAKEWTRLYNIFARIGPVITKKKLEHFLKEHGLGHEQRNLIFTFFSPYVGNVEKEKDLDNKLINQAGGLFNEFIFKAGTAEELEEHMESINLPQKSRGILRELYNGLVQQNSFTDIQIIQERFGLADRDFLYPCIISAYHAGTDNLAAVVRYFRIHYGEKEVATLIGKQSAYGLDIFNLMNLLVVGRNNTGKAVVDQWVTNNKLSPNYTGGRVMLDGRGGVCFDGTMYGSRSAKYALKILAYGEAIRKLHGAEAFMHRPESIFSGLF